MDDEPVEEIPDQVGDDREAVGDVREAVVEDKAGVGALRIVLWSVLGLVVLFFALLAILGRVAPQLVDPLLYNSQELELLRQLL